jgi:uncharacterized membrane protein YdjX (TVP38/TMEM64 family)
LGPFSWLYFSSLKVGNLLYVPGWVFLVGAVFALGKEWGGVATFIAGLCSSTLSFYVIRRLGGTALRSLNHRWADKIFAHLDERPIVSVTLLRLLFQTLPALTYALALADIRFRHYFLGTFLGLPVPIFLYWFPCRGYQGDIGDTWSHLFPIVGIGREEYPLSSGGGESEISCRGGCHKPTRACRFPVHQNVF